MQVTRESCNNMVEALTAFLDGTLPDSDFRRNCEATPRENIVSLLDAYKEAAR